jgi:pimeloyl-ACP methyl ester carboxylesterase
MSEPGTVTSRDGSVIGFRTVGVGPPLLLVHGGIVDRRSWGGVRGLLAEHFTVHAMDRRGRGLSTDEREPYDIAREGEDVAAVVEAVGSGVYVVAHSYGARCSLEAARVTDGIGRMVLYEPPMSTSGRPVAPPPVLEDLRAADRANDRDRIVETFFRDVIDLPAGDIDAMRGGRAWAVFCDNARALVREGESIERTGIPDWLSTIEVPTRVLVGTESVEHLRIAAATVAERLPHADLVELPGQGHLAVETAPDLFVDAVRAFAE